MAEALVDMWILDTCCYYHMSLYADWFDSYKSVTVDVSMGNNISCKVVDIDNVKILMFDGIMRVLKDV